LTGESVTDSRPRVAVVSAMHEELRALLPLLERSSELVMGGRRCHVGEIAGQAVVLALSGIGKVAAATTATVLATRFALTAMVLTGVAGGLAEGVQVGDVVVADTLLQHDLDASPLFPRYVVPGTGRSHFQADVSLTESLALAAQRQLTSPHSPWAAALHEALPQAHASVRRGLVVSGDRFVSTSAESRALQRALPEALAVEMEGAALAQVCSDFALPFAVLRIISDRADDAAHVDFTRFIDEVASACTRAIVHDWLMARSHTS
jgi:adenosylhomocysteine nucleosidase